MRMRSRPYRDDNANVSRIVGVAWDVTERRKTELSLAKERNLLKTLMDNLPHAIYFKDLDSRFVAVSRALTHSFGKTDPAEIIGKTDHDFFPRSTPRGRSQTSEKSFALENRSSTTRKRKRGPIVMIPGCRPRRCLCAMPRVKSSAHSASPAISPRKNALPRSLPDLPRSSGRKTNHSNKIWKWRANYRVPFCHSAFRIFLTTPTTRIALFIFIHFFDHR